MKRDICTTPTIVLFCTGLIICGVGLFGDVSYGHSEYSRKMTSLKPHHESHPDLAIKNGYFVSHEEAVLRGGVGNYVPRPTGKEEKRLGLYKDIRGFSSFHRTENGDLEVYIDKAALFKTNSSEVDKDAQRNLDKVADLMVMEDIGTVRIYGYTDSTGPESYNDELSEKRAVAVQDYLGSKLVGAEFISYGMGESEPIESNSTENGRSSNRRSEIRLSE